MTAIESQPESASSGRRGLRMTQEAARRWRFQRAPLGRRGVLESDVEQFRLRVADALARADGDKADLRAANAALRKEIERLHDYFRDHRIDPALDGFPLSQPTAINGPGGAGSRDGLARTGPRYLDPQAVNLMSAAQQAADQHIAQAEEYARQLVRDARLQYEEILLTAHRQAQAAAAAAARPDGEMCESSGGDRPSDEDAEAAQLLRAKLAYLRTFADVTQVQMASIMDALRKQLDDLASLPGKPQAADGIAAPGTSDAAIDVTIVDISETTPGTCAAGPPTPCIDERHQYR